MSTDNPVMAPGLSVAREALTCEEIAALGIDLADFPGASPQDFERYPVLSEGGWFMVVKHRPTLTSVSREPWGLFGPVEPTSTGFLKINER